MLPARVLEALKARRKAQLSEPLHFGWSDHAKERVFTNVVGGWIDPDWLTHAFAKAATRAKAPAVRFHDLRHAAATEMIRAGIDAKTVSTILGHSSIAFTLGTYVHADQERLEAAAAAMDLYA